MNITGAIAAIKLFASAHRVALMVSAVVALVVGAGVAKCAYDKSVINDYKAGIEKKAAPARETAADERLIDAAENAKKEQEQHNVIDTTPNGGASLPASTLAHNCDRLRRLGRVPPACRPNGGE